MRGFKMSSFPTVRKVRGKTAGLDIFSARVRFLQFLLIASQPSPRAGHATIFVASIQRVKAPVTKK